jgi:branched-chain amino acid transport system permease protein
MLLNALASIDPYTLQILVNIGIGIILAQGLNIITGMTGQLSLGHAAFMSIGAFTGALLTIKTGTPFYLTILLSGLATAGAAALVGWPILRLSGDYLAICTLGFAEIVKVVFLNLDITNRALGLTVPSPDTFLPMPVLVLIAVILTVIAASFIDNSRFGRALKAIRDDEIAAEATGINIARFKAQSFAVSAFMAGVGGCLYAHFIGYINPSDFGFLKSIDMLSMVVLGGLGSIPGAVLGATLLSAAPEFLRFMSQYRMMVYGALLVFLMVFRPNGLLGGVDFSGLLMRKLGIKPRTRRQEGR